MENNNLSEEKRAKVSVLLTELQNSINTQQTITMILGIVGMVFLMFGGLLFLMTLVSVAMG